MSANGGVGRVAAVWLVLSSAGCQHRAMLDGPTRAELGIAALPAAVRGGSTRQITVSLTTNLADASGQVVLEHSLAPGWEVVASQSCTGGPFDAEALTFSWQVPAVDEPAHVLRATWSGVYGNHVTTEGAPFVIDSTPPSITSFTVGTGAAQETAHVLPLTLVATDGAGSGVTAVMVSLDPTFAGASWQSAAPATFDVPRRTGTYTLYARARDAVGLDSEVASTTVEIVVHAPPVIDFVEPLATRRYEVAGAPVSVGWVASASAGLAQVSLGYSLDGGATVVLWADDLPAATAGCAGGASGCATPALPAVAAGQPFWIAAAAVDTIGQSAAVVSLPLNAPRGLAVAAGRNSSLIGASALATALALQGGIGRDPATGDLLLSARCQLLRYAQATGTLARVAGDSRHCSEGGDGGASAAVRTNPQGDVSVDSRGNVYWTTYGFVWRADAAAGTASVYLGDMIAGPGSTADGTPRRAFEADGTLRHIMLGAGDRLYAVLTTWFATTGQTHAELFVVADDGTVSAVAGTRASDAAPAPTEGASAREVALGSFAVAPGYGSRPDRVFATGRGAGARPGLWQILADGTMHLLRDDAGDELLGWLPSRRQLVLGASTAPQDELRFVDPDRPDDAKPAVATRDSYGAAAGAVTDDGSGGFYYTSSRGRHVLRVDAAGVTDVYAGIEPASGAGGIAQRAELRGVAALGFDAGGSSFVYEQENGGVWQIDTSGVITATPTAPPNGLYRHLEALSSGAGGPVLAGGFALDGQRGVRDVLGQCVWFCADPATSPFAGAATLSADVQAGLADGAADGSGLEVSIAFDGSTAYVHVIEQVAQPAGVRTRIKRIVGSALDEIAGDPAATPVDVSASAAPLKITTGAALAGTPAGWPALGRWSFQAGGGRVFVLQSDSTDAHPWTTPFSLWSGATGGTWRREVTADVRAYAVDAARGRVYYATPDNEGHVILLWRKTLGVADERVVADFDDVARGVKPLAVAPTPTGQPVVYLLIGDYDTPTSIAANTLYRWVDPN